MAVPNPNSTVPPPAASHVDENIIVVDVIPLAGHFDLFSAGLRHGSSRNTLARCEKKGVFLAIAGHAVSHNKTRVINCLGHCQDFEIAVPKIADRVQIHHLTI